MAIRVCGCDGWGEARNVDVLDAGEWDVAVAFETTEDTVERSTEAVSI